MLVTESEDQFCAKMAQVVLNISTDSTIHVSPSEYAVYTKHLCREEIVFFGSDWYRCEKYQLFSCNQRYFDPGYDNTVDPTTVTSDAELGSTTTFHCCPGFYCPAQMTCLLPCPLGTFCPAPDYTQNEDTLRPCTGGGYCPTPLVASPIPCPTGAYCPTASAQPRACTSWVPRWDRCDGGSSTNPVFYQCLLSALLFLVALVVACEAMQATWMNPWRTGVPRCYTAAPDVPPTAACPGTQSGDSDGDSDSVAIVAMVFEEIRIWRHAQLVFILAAARVNTATAAATATRSLLPPKRWVLRPGITALVGLSGAGKSTLLAVLAQRSRLPHQITGSVYLRRPAPSTATPLWRETSYRSFHRTYGYAMGYVPQNALATLLCYQPMTVWEALWFHLRLRTGRRWCRPLGASPSSIDNSNSNSSDGADADPMRRHICFWLRRLRLLHRTTLVRQLVSTLSGGEVKRLAIAMELICEPSVLWLDEPTSGLDAHTAEDVLYALQCYARGMSSRRSSCSGDTTMFPATWRPGQRVNVPVGCTPRVVVMVVHQPSYEMARFFIDRLVGVAQYPVASTSMSMARGDAGGGGGGVVNGSDTPRSSDEGPVVGDDDGDNHGDAKELDVTDGPVGACDALDALDASCDASDVECGGVRVGVTVGHHLRVQREHVGSLREVAVQARRPPGAPQQQPPQKVVRRSPRPPHDDGFWVSSVIVASLDLPMKSLSSPPPPPPPSSMAAIDGDGDEAVVSRLLEDEAREVEELTRLPTFTVLQSIPPPPPTVVAEEAVTNPYEVTPQWLRRVNVLDNYLVSLAHPTTSLLIAPAAVSEETNAAEGRRWIDWFPAYDTSTFARDSNRSIGVGSGGGCSVVGLGRYLRAGHVLTWADHAWLSGLRAWTVMGHGWRTVWLGNVLLSMVFGFALGFFHGDLSSLAPSTMLQLPSAYYLLPLAISLVGVQAGIRLRRHGYLVDVSHDTHDTHDSRSGGEREQQQPSPSPSPSPSERATEERGLSEEGTKKTTKKGTMAAWSLAGIASSSSCWRWGWRWCRDGAARWGRRLRGMLMLLRCHSRSGSCTSRRENTEWTGYGFECVAGVRGVAVYCGECVAEAIWLGVMVSWLLVFFRCAAQARSPFFAQWWLLWATGLAATSVGHVLLVVRVTGGGGGDVGTWGVYMNLFCALLAGYSPQARDLLDTASSTSSSSSSDSADQTTRPVLFQMVTAASFTRDDPADVIVTAAAAAAAAPMAVTYAISSSSTTHPSTTYRQVQRYRAHSPYTLAVPSSTSTSTSTSSSSVAAMRWPFVNRAQWTASPSFLAPAFQALLLLELQSLVAPSRYTALRVDNSSHSSHSSNSRHNSGFSFTSPVPSFALPVAEAAGTLRTLWRMYNVLGDCETLLYTLPLAPIHRVRYGLTVDEAGNATGRILRLQCPLHYTTSSSSSSDVRGLAHVQPTMWTPWGFYLAWLLVGYTLAVRVLGVCLGGTLLGTAVVRPPRQRRRGDGYGA